MDEDDEPNSLDFCPHYRSYVESGISCDASELWFYYQCEGLDPLMGMTMVTVISAFDAVVMRT